jgi:hypothetical protein
MQTKFAKWLTGAALSWSLAAREHEAERARVGALVDTIEAVAMDPNESPIFTGDDGRARTAILLASIASYESNFRADVADGRKRGDGGKSVCLLQIRFPTPKYRIVLTTRGWDYSFTEGHTADEVAASPELCARIALRMARQSVRGCGNLSAYTSGKCQPDEKRATVREFRATAGFKAWKKEEGQQ